MYYKCVVRDYFGKLEVGKVYYIEDNWLYTDNKMFKLYYISDYMLHAIFEEVCDDK